MTQIKRVFTHHGKPFFSLGGQARNSSGYNPAEFDQAFKALHKLGGNTLLIPIYWEQVEPVEGQFNFESVQAILERARQDGVKLILLWFATWKNGKMVYTPAWVKQDPARFKRVISPTGRSIWVLSSHCDDNFKADKKAFLVFCQYLQENDPDGTVLSIQIENEPGIMGSDRDYGPEAQAIFEGEVPADFLEKLNTAPNSPVYQIWQQAGGKESGNWPTLFGDAAGELMSAWSIARYIDKLAEAGKQILDRPMYINVWLGEMYWRIAGESFPSGGATSKTLDIYKWYTLNIDLIAPDIYISDNKGFEQICANYSRTDNPFFVPESLPFGSNAWLIFRAIADYHAIGYHVFAIENTLEPDGTVIPPAQMLAESYRCLRTALPLLHEYQGTDKIHAVVQEENMSHQVLDFEGYHGMVWFGETPINYVPQDWRHQPRWLTLQNGDPQRGRGLIFQVSKHEFYVVGSHFRLVLRPKANPECSIDPTLAVPFLLTRLANYVTVEEGHFDDSSQFIHHRYRNGDETNGGIWVEPDTGVVRVVLAP